ncbi:MAG: hypothetical protein OXE78_02595 [Gammaproteobacteria bacterium]|nr:hypothetical protein [Gammaproteobacteria bacterium]MCY4358565.1 hypothetical protein [Gammaproteobacteria bacterium]
MERVKIWDDFIPSKHGIGIYAGRMMQNYPWLPVEEERRLDDAVLRENFIQRVFVMHRWHQLVAAGLAVATWSNFMRTTS